MLGYAAALSRKAWEEFDTIGSIPESLLARFAAMNVSDVLVYKREFGVKRVKVDGFQPAWRIASFTCDATPSNLSKLNWDDIRALGFGERRDLLRFVDDVFVDLNSGAVSGVKVDCTALRISDPHRYYGVSSKLVATTVTYAPSMSAVAFGVENPREGLLLLPFGYARDIRVQINGMTVPIARTDQWMTVVVAPAGALQISISSQSWLFALRRGLDLAFVCGLLVVGFEIIATSAKPQRSKIA